MPLPTGSAGISWISSSLGGSNLTINLPTTYSYVYQAQRTPSIISSLAGIPSYSVYYSILPVEVYSTASTVVGGNTDRLEIYQTSNMPFGLVDTQFIDIAPVEVILNLGPVVLKYSTVKAPSERRGLYIQCSSGSPHLSLEPVDPDASTMFSGDVWFRENSSSLNRGLYYADFSPNTQSTTESIASYVIISSDVPDTFDGGSW